MTDQELLAARDEAWIKWVDWENEEYYPKWYRRAKGWINPWLTLGELLETQKYRKELFNAWLQLHFQCYDRGLPAMSEALRDRWSETQTPDGRRYIKNHAN